MSAFFPPTLLTYLELFCQLFSSPNFSRFRTYIWGMMMAENVWLFRVKWGVGLYMRPLRADFYLFTGEFVMTQTLICFSTVHLRLQRNLPLLRANNKIGL